jgi:hypothetical protein
VVWANSAVVVSSALVLVSAGEFCDENLIALFAVSSGVRSWHATKELSQRTFTSVSIAPELLVLRASMQLNTPVLLIVQRPIMFIMFGFGLGFAWEMAGF